MAPRLNNKQYAAERSFDSGNLPFDLEQVVMEGWECCERGGKARNTHCVSNFYMAREKKKIKIVVP